MAGYVKLHRSCLTSWFWTQPAAYLKVGLTLLLSAEWRDGAELERGQVMVSWGGLARRAGDSRATAVRALQYLEEQGFVTRESRGGRMGGQVIAIQKFDRYQAPKTVSQRARLEAKPSHKEQECVSQRARLCLTESTFNAATPENQSEKHPLRTVRTIRTIYRSSEGEKKGIWKGVSEQHRAVIERCIERLNDWSPVQYSAGKGVVSRLHRLLRDGYTERQIREVIWYKGKEWKGSPLAKFIRPRTLFGPTNFADYQPEASAVAAKMGVVLREEAE